MRLTPTHSDAGAAIVVAGTLTRSGSPSALLAVAAQSATNIAVAVTTSVGDRTDHDVVVARAPGAVRDLSATAAAESLALTWAAPAFAGTHPAAAAYRVRWRAGDGAPWQPSADGRAVTWTAGSAGASHTVAGLEAATPHEVQVWAQNTGGAGPGASVTATPLFDADLVALSVASVTGAGSVPAALSPAFDPEVLAYVAGAAPGVTAVRVTATAGVAGATVTVAGTEVGSGEASAPLALAPTEALTVPVTVTAPDGATSAYSIVVARPPGAVRNLAAVPGVGSLALTWAAPAFEGTHTGEAAYRVRWRAGEGPWQPGPDGRAVAYAAGNNSHTLDGLAHSTAYEVQVWAANSGGAGPAEAVTAETLSGDSALSALSVSGAGGEAIALVPAFSPGVTAYVAAAALAVTGVKLTATLSDDAASLTVAGAPVGSGEASATLALAPQVARTVPVTVTSSGGATTTYRVELARPPGAVRDLEVTPGAGSLGLSWTGPAFEGTYPLLAGYRVRWRPVVPTGDAPWQPDPAGRGPAPAPRPPRAGPSPPPPAPTPTPSQACGPTPATRCRCGCGRWATGSAKRSGRRPWPTRSSPGSASPLPTARRYPSRWTRC